MLRAPLFRAFVTLKLFDLARLRPEEWGMQWCPVAARHLQALKDLGALDLKSGDWMVRVPLAKYEASFQKYFERARNVPLEKQAAFLQQLAQQACETDFTYAGFIDVDGRPVAAAIWSARSGILGLEQRLGIRHFAPAQAGWSGGAGQNRRTAAFHAFVCFQWRPPSFAQRDGPVHLLPHQPGGGYYASVFFRIV